MATTYFAGSAGRMKSVAVTPDLSVMTPTLTGLSTTTTAEITAFDIGLTTEDGGPIYTYESSATAGGVLNPTRIQGGLGNTVVTVRGLYNGDSTSTDERFVNGNFVSMDLIFSKTSTLGRYAVGGKIMAYKESYDVKAQAVTFEATVETTGALPAPSIPS